RPRADQAAQSDPGVPRNRHQQEERESEGRGDPLWQERPGGHPSPPWRHGWQAHLPRPGRVSQAARIRLQGVCQVPPLFLGRDDGCPFRGGVKSSLLAAKGCWRRYLGIEREEKYVKIALGRLR